MINEEARLEIEDQYNKQLLRILYLNFEDIIENNDAKKAKTLLLFISNYDIMLFKRKFLGGYQQISRYSHADLKTLELTADKLRFEYKSTEFYFQSPNVSQIYNELTQSITTILTDDELPKFSPKVNITRKPHVSASRYKFICYNNNKRPDYEVYKFLNNFNSQTFDFESIASRVLPDIDYFMASLENLTAKCFIFPSFTKPIWSKLAPLVAKNQYIGQLVMKGPIDHDLIEVYNALKENKTSNITCLTFQDSCAEPKYFKLLIDFMKLDRIDQIEFDSVLADSHQVKDFTDCMVEGQPYNDISKLSLKFMPRIDFKTVHSCFPFLKNISFSNCNINLAKYLEYISTFEENGVQVFSLVGANADLAIRSDISLPPCLTGIDVSDIYWTSKNLLTFLGLISKFRNVNKNLRVGLSRIKMDSMGWSVLNKNISKFEDPQISELFWKENIFSAEILEFMNKCKLTLLTVGNNFEEDDPSILLFRDFLIRQNYLQTFIFAGGERVSNFQIELLRGIRYNRTINSLGIYDVDFNKEEKREFSLALRENCNIRQLSFLQFDKYSESELEKFFKKVSKRGPPLKINGFAYKVSGDKKHNKVAKYLKLTNTGDINVKVPETALKSTKESQDAIIASFAESDEKIIKMHADNTELPDHSNIDPNAFEFDEDAEGDLNDYTESPKKPELPKGKEESKEVNDLIDFGGSSPNLLQTPMDFLKKSAEFADYSELANVLKFENRMPKVPQLDIAVSRDMLAERFALASLRDRYRAIL